MSLTDLVEPSEVVWAEEPQEQNGLVVVALGDGR